MTKTGEIAGRHTLTIRMVSPQRAILREIGDKRVTRDGVATTYAWCIRQHEECAFLVINRAILKRWSPYALDYIKAKAWKLIGASDG